MGITYTVASRGVGPNHIHARTTGFDRACREADKARAGNPDRVVYIVRQDRASGHITTYLFDGFHWRESARETKPQAAVLI